MLNKSKIILICALISFTACTKEQSGSGGSTTFPNSGTDTSGAASGEATTDCGVVFHGSLENPVTFADGEEVKVKEVLGTNLVSIISTAPDAAGAQLLKLHGVAAGPSSKSQAAKNMIRNLTSKKVYFYKATEDCEASLPGGGVGTIGQLITTDGQSVSEALIGAGLADVDSNDACGGDQIGSCLNALEGQNVEPVAEMRDFLWKPVSDTKGNIAVVLEKHCNTRILVNGTELEYVGSGNGRCGTFAAKKSGCAHGGNIRVEVFDKNTGRPYTYKGNPYVIVPNGCNRFEFK